MPYLWCDDCGTRKEEMFKTSTKYDGESVFIASGALVIGEYEYRCDDCNKPMVDNDKAIFCAFLSAGQKYDVSQLVPFFGVCSVDHNTYK